MARCNFVIDFFVAIYLDKKIAHKKIAIYMTMVRAGERFANLGVAYMEGDVLARRLDSVK